MMIEMLDVSTVKEYEKNPREISDAAVDAVAASIKEFGFRNPVIVDKDNVLVAGHTRVRAAKKLGMTQVPAIRADDLTPEQIRAFRIADNKLHELARWDYELLPIELGELQAAEFDLGLMGFDEEELAGIMGPGALKDGLTDPDQVPEPPDAAVTQPGDLWTLGEHRLLCGDAGKAEDVDRLLDGATIHLVNTDPPYNVRVEPRSNNAIALAVAQKTVMHHQSMDIANLGGPDVRRPTDRKMRPRDRALQGDFETEEDFARLLRAWFGQMARVLEPGRGFYIWGGYANLGNYPPALAESGLYFSQGIVWDKQHPVLTRKDMMGAFELAFYGWKEGAAHKYFGPNNATDLWHVKKVNPASMIHLTEKPVELAVRAIQYSSLSGENVLDLFGGSGSTLIACEQTGRRAFLMEIDALYADVIVQRWEQFAGRKAERNTTEAAA